MSETEGAAAPAEDVVAPPAATESKPAGQEDTSVKTDAAPDNADAPQQQDETPEEEVRRRLSRSQRQQRKIARLTTMLTNKDAEIEELRKSVPSGPRPPNEADFNGDYLAYQRALTKFDTEQVVSAAVSKLVPQDNKSDLQKLDREDALHDLQARVQAANIPDFEESLAALHKRVAKLSDAVVEEISESDKGELILYHLAKNPDLAASINNMSARDVAREIGRLEAKVALPQPKRQTQAPSPLRPLTGGASPSPSLHDLAKADNMDAYVKARNEQDKARRR